jgi:hypothetical protein
LGSGSGSGLGLGFGFGLDLLWEGQRGGRALRDVENIGHAGVSSGKAAGA